MSSFLTTQRKIWLGAIAALLVLNCFAWKDAIAFAVPHRLTVSLLDIGQGDSIFIETPSKRHVLIDGGPTGAVLEKLQSRLPFWDKNIDVVVLTHPDADHLNGLLSVLQKYHVEHIIWTGIDREGAAFEEWKKLLVQQQSKGSQITTVHSGDSIKNGTVELGILNPLENLEGQFYDKEGNDTGIVAKLTYGDRTFLFTADVSNNIEQRLIDAKLDMSADVLKIGHHGSKYSSSDAFLEQVHPSIAAISVGARNTYGHPTTDVLQRLEEFGITTLRTDKQGDINFSTNGDHITVTTQR